MITKTPKEIAREIFKYFGTGSSLEPAIVSALRQARNDALEEAAFEIAVGGAANIIEKLPPLAAWAKGVEDHAAYVRTLKGKP